MANIKTLKKEINLLTNELLSECFVYKHFHPNSNEVKLDEIIIEIVNKRNELIAQINNPGNDSDSKKIRAHFKTIINDVDDNFITILDKLKNL